MLALPKPIFGGVKVLMANGAAHGQIPNADIHAAWDFMSANSVQWEFTNYAAAGHGFTHPVEASQHFHFDANAESRYWTMMQQFLSLIMNPTYVSGTVQITEDAVAYQDGDTQPSGYIAYPTAAAEGSLPVLIHVHAGRGIADFEKGRAARTAAGLGYVGFAVSVYTDNETVAAGGTMQTIMGIMTKYHSNPDLHVSRITAAVQFAKAHKMVDPTRIAACAYCFGGTSVLQFAKRGGASAAGVAAVVSFHGGLKSVLISSGMSYDYCPTRVADSSVRHR